MVADEEDFNPKALPYVLTDIDRAVLAQTDEDFHSQTWKDLKQIICTGPRTNI